uniref:Uncharacterized protein n=1 Tax=Rhizophora mucronata TaxID=61149 RepID=A0A2P2P1W4_RHIMU
MLIVFLSFCSILVITHLMLI